LLLILVIVIKPCVIYREGERSIEVRKFGSIQVFLFESLAIIFAIVPTTTVVSS